MAVIVQKYGGSSVADVRKLKRVAARVMQAKQQGDEVVVVVSAMGDTTDELLGMAKQVSQNPSRRELDMLLSAGERISMALLSMAIRELGGDAISFTGSQSGIITNDRHVDARIIEVRPFRIQDELSRGRVVVVAGYQGVSYKKEVTTLGRGGSDTTAVALAAALDAEYCEICSDVDGVYSADPRVVADATRIATLSYEETQEMAEAGAKVLNAQAVEFAKEKGIAIYARATDGPLPGPDPSSDGTVVRKSPPRMPGVVVGVASERDIIVLEGDLPAGDLLALLDERGVAGKQLHAFRARTTLVISRDNLHDEDALRSALEARFTGRARLVDGLAAVSAVGAGINASYNNLRVGAETLTEHGIAPAGVATSSFRITWLVPRDRIADAVRLLHKRFIGASEARKPSGPDAPHSPDAPYSPHSPYSPYSPYCCFGLATRTRSARKKSERSSRAPLNGVLDLRLLATAAGRATPRRFSEGSKSSRYRDVLATISAISSIVGCDRRSPFGNSRQNSSTVSSGSRPTTLA